MLDEQLARRPRAVLDWMRRLRSVDEPGPLYRSMMVLDVAGFGRLHNRAQLGVRTALHDALRTAFRGTGVRWSALAVEDRGDGGIILAPPTVSKLDLLDPVLPNLAAAVREYNAAADPGQRFRLRVSVHAGEVHRDATGWVGTDLNVACRLVSSAAVCRHLLQRPGVDLLVVVSDAVYQAVVRHEYRGIRSASYEPVHVSLKELNTRAWVHVP
jgi:class 3 adenylate cyclase